MKQLKGILAANQPLSATDINHPYAADEKRCILIFQNHQPTMTAAYEEFKGMAINFIIKEKGTPHSDFDGIYSSAFTRLWGAIMRKKVPPLTSKLSTYFKTFVENEWKQWLRSRGRRSKHETLLPDFIERFSDIEDEDMSEKWREDLTEDTMKTFKKALGNMKNQALVEALYWNKVYGKTPQQMIDEGLTSYANPRSLSVQISKAIKNLREPIIEQLKNK